MDKAKARQLLMAIAALARELDAEIGDDELDACKIVPKAFFNVVELGYQVIMSHPVKGFDPDHLAAEAEHGYDINDLKRRTGEHQT